MPQWIALSKSEHAQSRYWPREGYQFAKNEQVIPVLLAELGKLLPSFTLAFIKDDKQYLPVAITGLGQGNLYLHPQGQWLGNYIPAMLRGYPFRILTTEAGEPVVCLAEAHLTEDPAAEPLFEADGALAKPVAETVEFLRECEKNRQVTMACVQKLVEADVIEAWPLALAQGEGQETVALNGLYRINEQALNSVDAATLHSLRGGPLSLAYAQMLSTHQLEELTKRAELQSKLQAQTTTNRFDNLFDEDEKLTFDFDN